MKKKIVAVLLSAMVAMSAVACGGSSAAEFVVENYDGIEIEAVELVETTDEDVEGYIDMMLSYETKTVEVERASVDGDVINIDYVGTVDGEEFEGGAAEYYDLYLGSGTFIDGFEDQLIGAKAGDKVIVEVTFPVEYGSEELAGKDAVFTVQVNMVQELETPVLNKAYVQSVSEVSTTVAEYKEEIKALLIEQNQLAVEDGLKSQAWTALIDGILAEYEAIEPEVEVEEAEVDEDAEVEDAEEETKELKKFPESEIKEIEDTIIESISTQAVNYGMELSDYVASAGMDDESFAAYVTTSAKQEYIMKSTVKYIANQEDLNLSTEEMENAVYELIAMAGFESVEAAIEMGYSQEDLELNVLTEIVVGWITDRAVIIDPNAEEVEETEESEEIEESEEDAE